MLELTGACKHYCVQNTSERRVGADSVKTYLHGIYVSRNLRSCMCVHQVHRVGVPCYVNRIRLSVPLLGSTVQDRDSKSLSLRAYVRMLGCVSAHGRPSEGEISLSACAIKGAHTHTHAHASCVRCFQGVRLDKRVFVRAIEWMCTWYR